MSYADRVFKETCKEIIENGTTTEGQKVRPVWDDGSSAYTKKIFGVCNKYDLRKEFPAITLRRIALKSAMDEILWIYQKKSNNIHELNSHIWDEWADYEGSIGKAYGYQINKDNIYKGVNVDGLYKAFPNIEKKYFIGEKYSLEEYWSNSRRIAYKEINEFTLLPEKDFHMNQMDKVIYDLVNTPFSRRIMTTTWNPVELHEMNLEPCAYSMTYNVTEENGQLVLNAILNQRSQDMLAANGWNVAQYAILLMMIARHVNMVPGVLMHVIADCHIYDKHIPMINELLDREEFTAPKVSLNPDIHNFYDFTTNDLIVEDYKYGEQIKNIPIAV